MKTNTTIIGDELRDQVIRLLEAEGLNVKREIRVDTKKIDILLEIDDEYNSQRIAIECKNENRNLSQADVNRIYADHLTLIECGEITDIFIIGKKDFSPEAKSYAARKRDLNIFSIAEFEEKKLGYRNYCRLIGDMFLEKGLDTYFIHPKMLDGQLLHDQVIKWIKNDDVKPMALLGGYGMGKTSYCKFLSNYLAEHYLENSENRVPIYVKLSDIATQVDIDGLIAKTLTSRYMTTNYSYAKFQKLNRTGKYVIIFDGFDEMKHALSWSEFKYNFSQIHSLLEGKAKVIIAGRPNAFLSDIEHAHVLKGIQTQGDQQWDIPGAPKYIENELSQFSDADADQFLKLYLYHYCRIEQHLAENEIADWINEKVSDFAKIKGNGDLYRPVHLQIYADIARNPNAKLEKFNTYELYQIASTQISERENEKHVRKEIGPAIRQRVIQDLAWWLWSETGGRSLNFEPELVPDHVIGLDILENQNYERSSLYREIFSGSFVERKLGEKYYFSHRSFLEFFVARRIENADKNEIQLQGICKNINPEILEFIKQSGNFEEFLSYAFEKMQRFSGEIPQLLLDEVIENSNYQKPTFVQLPILMLFKYYAFATGKNNELERVTSDVLEDLNSKNQEARETALYFFLDGLKAITLENISADIIAPIIKQIAESVNWHQFRDKPSHHLSLPKYNYSRESIGAFIFLRACRIAAEKANNGKDDILVFDVSKAFSEIHELRAPKIIIAGQHAENAKKLEIRFHFDSIFCDTDKKTKKIAKQVLETGIAAGIR